MRRKREVRCLCRGMGGALLLLLATSAIALAAPEPKKAAAKKAAAKKTAPAKERTPAKKEEGPMKGKGAKKAAPTTKAVHTKKIAPAKVRGIPGKSVEGKELPARSAGKSFGELLLRSLSGEKGWPMFRYTLHVERMGRLARLVSVLQRLVTGATERGGSPVQRIMGLLQQAGGGGCPLRVWMDAGAGAVQSLKGLEQHRMAINRLFLRKALEGGDFAASKTKRPLLRELSWLRRLKPKGVLAAGGASFCPTALFARRLQDRRGFKALVGMLLGKLGRRLGAAREIKGLPGTLLEVKGQRGSFLFYVWLKPGKGKNPWTLQLYVLLNPPKKRPLVWIRQHLSDGPASLPASVPLSPKMAFSLGAFPHGWVAFFSTLEMVGAFAAAHYSKEPLMKIESLAGYLKLALLHSEWFPPHQTWIRGRWLQLGLKGDKLQLQLRDALNPVNRYLTAQATKRQQILFVRMNSSPLRLMLTVPSFLVLALGQERSLRRFLKLNELHFASSSGRQSILSFWNSGELLSTALSLVQRKLAQNKLLPSCKKKPLATLGLSFDPQQGILVYLPFGAKTKAEKQYYQRMSQLLRRVLLTQKKIPPMAKMLLARVSFHPLEQLGQEKGLKKEATTQPTTRKKTKKESAVVAKKGKSAPVVAKKGLFLDVRGGALLEAVGTMLLGKSWARMRQMPLVKILLQNKLRLTGHRSMHQGMLHTDFTLQSNLLE